MVQPGAPRRRNFSDPVLLQGFREFQGLQESREFWGVQESRESWEFRGSSLGVSYAVTAHEVVEMRGALTHLELCSRFDGCAPPLFDPAVVDEKGVSFADYRGCGCGVHASFYCDDPVGARVHYDCFEGVLVGERGDSCRGQATLILMEDHDEREVVILKVDVRTALGVDQVLEQGLGHMLEVQAAEYMTEGMTVGDVIHTSKAGGRRSRRVAEIHIAEAVGWSEEDRMLEDMRVEVPPGEVGAAGEVDVVGEVGAVGGMDVTGEAGGVTGEAGDVGEAASRMVLEEAQGEELREVCFRMKVEDKVVEGSSVVDSWVRSWESAPSGEDIVEGTEEPIRGTAPAAAHSPAEARTCSPSVLEGAEGRIW